MPHDAPDAPHDFAAERRRNAKRRPPPTPRGVHLDYIDLNGIHAEHITKPGNAGPLILYFHGGGFTVGVAKERRSITFYLVDKLGYNCIANDYRLAPEHKYPAALEDCCAAYRGVLALGYQPRDIILMGESAGGTLVLAVALKLKQDGLPLPGLLASFSPVTTVAEDLPSHKGNIATDYMLAQDICNPHQLDAYLGNENITPDYLRDPLVSPLYGDYAELPPLFLAASDYEVMYDDVRLLHDKLQQAGHDVTIDVQHGVCHAYPTFPALRESRDTLRKFDRFARERLGR